VDYGVVKLVQSYTIYLSMLNLQYSYFIEIKNYFQKLFSLTMHGDYLKAQTV